MHVVFKLTLGFWLALPLPFWPEGPASIALIVRYFVVMAIKFLTSLFNELAAVFVLKV